MTFRSERAWGAILACGMLCWQSEAQASECESDARCPVNGDQDLVQLRDGTAICGTIVHQQAGHSIIIVSDAITQTLAWDEIKCIRTEPPKPKAVSVSVSASPEEHRVAIAEPAAWSGIFLEWDLRALGTGLLKHYERNGDEAWSWGLGGGIAFGAALRYQRGPTLDRTSGIVLYILQLGIEASVSYASWHQVNAGSASIIQQDFSLALGGRVAIGETRAIADGQRVSGVMLGLAWLPTYVDFYGAQISTHGKINPAGVRLTVDIGGAAGPGRGHASLLRLALVCLPYVGRLPTAYAVSAGVLFF